MSRYQPYPEYKDSGVEWIGEVPVHWEKTALKYLGDYYNGDAFKPEDRGEEGIPIVRISQLTSNDKPAYYAGQADPKSKIIYGDLLFSWSTTIDPFIWRGSDAWLNQHIFRVVPSKITDKNFLFYLIKKVAPILADFDAHGTTMRHIKKESLGNRIYAPNLNEQSQIATFLDRETTRIDTLVEKKQRFIELLEEKRQAVITQAVTKGLDPNVPMKDSGVEWIGEVPAHWGVAQFWTIVSHRDESGSESDGLLSVYLDRGVIPYSEGGGLVHKPSESLEKYQLVLPGDLVMNNQQAWRGSVGVSKYRGIVSPAYLVFRINESLLKPHFAAFAIRDRVYVEKIMICSLSVGTIQRQVKWPYLRKLPVLLPPVAEQSQIATFLDRETTRIDTLIEKTRDSIELLKERRAALITAAVTGKIDVREEAAA